MTKLIVPTALLALCVWACSTADEDDRRGPRDGGQSGDSSQSGDSNQSGDTAGSVDARLAVDSSTPDAAIPDTDISTLLFEDDFDTLNPAWSFDTTNPAATYDI